MGPTENIRSSSDSSVSHIALNLSVKNQEKEVSVEQKLSDIGEKILNNQSLNQPDKLFLKDIVNKTSVKRNAKSNKIDKLCKNIISKNISVEKTKNEISLLVHENKIHVKQVQASIAKLLLETDKERNGSHIIEKIVQNIQEKKPLTHLQIKQLIDKHNQKYPPSKELSGSLAFETNDIKIIYDSSGKLQILSPGRLLTSEITLKKSNQNLRAKDIESIKETYNSIANNLRYNNLSPMLELAKHIRESKANNPNISFNESFDTYSPDPDKLYQKYQSGDCVIAAGKLQSELARKGFSASVTGERTRPVWSTPPIADTSSLFKWDSYDRATNEIHHCHTVLLYSDESGKQQGMDLDITFSPDDRPEAIVNWKDTASNIETFVNIENISHTLKAQMLGKYKLIVEGGGSDTNNKPLLGVDLIRGNIYLNSSGSKGLNLPVNQDGRVSINLDDFSDPEIKRTYSFNEEHVEMNALEVLEIVYNETKERFQLPSDFVQNMTTLAQASNTLINQALLPPISTAKMLSKEMNRAVIVKKTINEKMKRFKNSEDETEKNYYLQGIKFDQIFDEFQRAIIDNNPDLAKQKFIELENINNNLQSIDQESINKGKGKSAIL